MKRKRRAAALAQVFAVTPLPALRYVSDQKPGIVRHRRGKSFSYHMPDGRVIQNPDVLSRIRSLAIPPAWTQVWICSLENGHIQATGRDARGRKQYRYHPAWREVRDGNKYERVLAFGAKLPAIRRRVAADLRREGMPREKVLATVVKLLETTLIRVGNDEYASANGSYGLTTLRNRHARVLGDKITFGFNGKGGKKHCIDIRDGKIARLMRKCQELPGQELFAYVDEAGEVKDVTSEDVNSYLREVAGAEYSAKDFRTWAGTVLAATALREFDAFHSQRQAKLQITQAIEAVSRMLGNTPAICRKCYVHPQILDTHIAGGTASIWRPGKKRQRTPRHVGLRAEETAVMEFLRSRASGSPKRKRPSITLGRA